MKIRVAFLLLVVGFIATSSSCTKRSLNALNPCTINGVVQNVPVNPQRALDVLFIIDDSPSMQDEQEKLAVQVPRLVNLLLTGGEADPDAVGTFPAVESLHVSVITPDLGHSTVPPHEFTASDVVSMVVQEVDFQPTPECTRNSGNGKAGAMLVTGFEGDPRTQCVAETPADGAPYLNINPDSSFTPAEFVDDVECVTGQGAPGNWGCGFEQQLESILASDRNTANAGFSREDALLAVVLITDEDDCSTTDPRVFDIYDRDSTPADLEGPFTTGGDLQFNLRCSALSAKLQEIERYVNGVAGLKSDPSQIVFAAITGIPEDPDLDRKEFVSDEERYQAILDHPDMEEIADPSPDPTSGCNEPQADTAGQQLRPACTAPLDIDGTACRSRAFPGNRIVQTMKGLAEGDTGVGTVVESICAEDYAPALNAIVDRIAAALRQLCLPRELNRDSQGMVGCEVREVQPEGVTCADAGRGREPDAVGEEDGRDVCLVTQLASDPNEDPPGGLGWFYDDFTPETASACSFNPEQQRVSFTEGAAPEAGARVRFECLQTAPPTTEDVGWPCTQDSMCDPNEDNCLPGEAVDAAGCEADPTNCCETRILKERYDRDNLELVCDTESNTCQLTCESDVQCPGGFACYDANEDGNSYCVNPTCSLN